MTLWRIAAHFAVRGSSTCRFSHRRRHHQRSYAGSPPTRQVHRPMTATQAAGVNSRSIVAQADSTSVRCRTVDVLRLPSLHVTILSGTDDCGAVFNVRTCGQEWAASGEMLLAASVTSSTSGKILRQWLSVSEPILTATLLLFSLRRQQQAARGSCIRVTLRASVQRDAISFHFLDGFQRQLAQVIVI